MSESYSVKLIRRRDGDSMSEHVRAWLASTGAYFDAKLDGFVSSGDGFPVSYAIFLPAHDLVVTDVTVDYNPEWFSPPSPAPVFERLSLPWDGCEVKTESGDPHSIVWFRAESVKDGRPFLASWGNGNWCVNGQNFGPNEVIAGGWTIIATVGECIQMGETRIDAAHAARLGKQAIEAIIEDLEGTAFQVGIASGRLRQAVLV